ncbi:hypothetical protein GJ744_005011 [Endocarpon pusillum]|uniref:Enoyl reductase (ER) domain-containing protein n=1 Tax=Endocarpon pusillum TaxID=364733 RepID=A0A8H7A805_9EURO|nr:hypothetical protein GJ744_005011 [Endocarpon pusillum]
MPSTCPTLSLPKHQTAIVAQGPGQLAIQHNAPVPLLAPDMAIVKTAAVAINPADAKMLDYSAAPGAIHGYDFAGTIVALGADSPGHLAIGDRVAGLVHGMNKLQPDVGAFAEYVGAYADLLLKIPDGMSFEEAASFGTGVATAALSLFSELRVPASLDQLHEHRAVSVSDGQADVEGKEREFVLVAGGSTATGTRAIQLLKLAGLRPIATCSPSNSGLVLRFGAEKVFDYNSPTCAADIRAYTRNELAYTLDCVSQADTSQLCYASMGRAGGRYVSLEPFRAAVAQTRALTVEPSWVMVLTIFGRKVALDGEYGRDARPQDRRFGGQAFAAVQALLDRELIDTHPVKAMPGGWEGVVQGVDIIRTQALSGHKLVYSVA